MRKLSRFVGATALVAVPVAAHAQSGPPPQLPDSIIDAAIRAGIEAKEVHIISTGEAAGGFGGAMLRQGFPLYEVYVEDPLTHIQNMAARNARKYLAFTRDSVPAEARVPYIVVRVVPGRPRTVAGHLAQAHPIEHVVLQGRGTDASGANYPVVQPAHVERDQVEWKNLLGATYTGEAMTAFFDPRLVPDADFDVVIINSGDESRWRIKREDIARTASAIGNMPTSTLMAECDARNRAVNDGDDKLVTLNDPEGGKCVVFRCRLKGAKDQPTDRAIAKCKDEPTLWEIVQ